MIFVILGTQDKSFPRLLEAIDEAKSQGKIKERIIVQAGCTKYESKNMEIFDYIPMDEFDDDLRFCRLLWTAFAASCQDDRSHRQNQYGCCREDQSQVFLCAWFFVHGCFFLSSVLVL